MLLLRRNTLLLAENDCANPLCECVISMSTGKSATRQTKEHFQNDSTNSGLFLSQTYKRWKLPTFAFLYKPAIGLAVNTG